MNDDVCVCNSSEIHRCGVGIIRINCHHFSDAYQYLTTQAVW